ncbi:phage portal protein, partial [Turicibacter sanguinis]
ALDNGMEFKSITQSSNFKEMLVNELKEDLDNAIYKTYRVPKSLILGDGKESSYASMNVIQQQFIKSLTPIILQIEQELNYKLLTTKEIQEGYYFKLNTKNALRMTDSERIDYYVKAIQSGVLSVNECRELEECNYREGADSLLMSLNYVPLDKWENYLESKNNAEKSGTALALTKNHLKGGEENESDEVL